MRFRVQHIKKIRGKQIKKEGDWYFFFCLYLCLWRMQKAHPIILPISKMVWVNWLHPNHTVRTYHWYHVVRSLCIRYIKRSWAATDYSFTVRTANFKSYDHSWYSTKNESGESRTPRSAAMSWNPLEYFDIICAGREYWYSEIGLLSVVIR